MSLILDFFEAGCPAKPQPVEAGLLGNHDVNISEREHVTIARIYRVRVEELAVARRRLEDFTTTCAKIEAAVKDGSLAAYAANRATQMDALGTQMGVRAVILELSQAYSVGACSRDFLQAVERKTIASQQANLDAFTKAYEPILRKHGVLT